MNELVDAHDMAGFIPLNLRKNKNILESFDRVVKINKYRRKANKNNLKQRIPKVTNREGKKKSRREL